MKTSRRDALKLLGAAAGTLFGLPGAAAASSMLTRPIPKSGEALPVIGMGTWQTFDVGSDESARAPLVEVLRLFFHAGGRVIDSSPMYGSSEEVVGDLLAQLGAPQPFLATKVWTTGRDAGIEQMEASLQKMRARRMDLLQVHNLVDWRTHLETLRRWKEEGRVRYFGVTHYLTSAFDELERVIRDSSIDFVQLPYSIALREAEKRLLPAAAERRVAVIVNRPFEGGSLFQQVRGRALPEWAREFDCESWAQYFLKFLLGHPAVTCLIPATANSRHMQDNLRAGFGRLPDEQTRTRMLAHLEL